MTEAPPRPIGPVLSNCLDPAVYGPLNGQPSHACYRCLGYHDANGRPLIGPCPVKADCIFGSKPGGAPHDGHHLARRTTCPARTLSELPCARPLGHDGAHTASAASYRVRP